jgi:hypothetical protein
LQIVCAHSDLRLRDPQLLPVLGFSISCTHTIRLPLSLFFALEADVEIVRA